MARAATKSSMTHTTNINTIFFDWGGVVADDPGSEFLRELLRSIGASEEQIQEIRATYTERFLKGQISEADYWKELKARYGFSIHDTISDDFKKWRGLIKNDDVVALVGKAKVAGLQVALLTNVIEPTYNVLADAGCYDYFDAVIASCKVGFAKPQEEIYQLALDQLHATAEQSVFVDDQQINLDPAARMGFTTILAQNPAQIIADVTRYIGA